MHRDDPDQAVSRAIARTMPLPAPGFAADPERLRIMESFAPDTLEDDPELSRIVSFVASLCDVPMSQISLVEDVRQRFLAREGITERETPRDIAFCDHAMRGADILEIRDARTDPRFADNPLVTRDGGVRFYAGHPLVSDEGAPLGALCAIDVEARPEGLTALQREGLAVLAEAVMRRLKERRTNIRAEAEIKRREQQLRQMIESVPQIAWSADAAGNFDYFNARWQELTGAPAPQLSQDWRPFVHPEDADRIFAKWRESFAQSTQFEGEYRLKKADGSWLWVLGQAVPVQEDGGDAVRWFGTITDIDEVRSALNERDMLAKELSHRIKNIFAVVIGLASLKARGAPEHKPYADELIDVLHTLGRAHDVVRAGGREEHESLLTMLEALFAPYADQSRAPRVRVSGSDACILPRAATPLALVFHELATNAAKYGALSGDAGHVEVTLEDAGDAIAIGWREIGGPPLSGEAPPQSQNGFGSRLVEMSITGQLQGSWEREFAESGLIVRLTVAKDALSG